MELVHAEKVLKGAQQTLYERLRLGNGDTSFPPLTGRSPSVGTIGSIKSVTFLTIADYRTAQFSDGDRVLFVRGVNMDNLVPNNDYEISGLFEVTEIIEFTALLGNRRRGPLCVRFDEGQARELATRAIAIQKEADGLCTLSVEGSQRVMKFIKLVDDRSRAVFEETIGSPETLDLHALTSDVHSWLIARGNGPLRIIAPADRPLLEAGHTFRPRKWATKDGKFSVEATFVSAKSDKVQLRRLDNGKEVEVDRKKLSDEDETYIAKKKFQADRIEPKDR